MKHRKIISIVVLLIILLSTVAHTGEVIALSGNTQYIEENYSQDIKTLEVTSENEFGIAKIAAKTQTLQYDKPWGMSGTLSPVVYSDNVYDYYVVQNTTSAAQVFKIIRHDIVQNKDEIVYTSGNTCKQVASYVRGSIIYVAYVPNYEFSKYDYNYVTVLKYDTVQNKISNVANFAITYDDIDYYPSFAVDSKERFYFVSNYEDVIVFDNKGNQYYKHKGLKESADEPRFEIIINGISPNDRALFFSSTSSVKTVYRYNEREGIQKLKDGKFVEEDGYTVFGHNLGEYYVEDPNWQFLDTAGKYAVNQYGELAEFNYDADTNMGAQYNVKVDLMRLVNDYYYSSQSSVPYIKVGNYLYLAGNDNYIIVMDQNYNKVKRLDLGLPTTYEYEIERLTYLNGTLYVRCYDNDNHNTVLHAVPNVESQLEEMKDIVYSSHSTQSHTKQQIKQKYESTLTYDYSKSIYKTKPSDSAPYAAGSLQDGVINDTVRRINFFRWLYGVSDVTANMAKMERNQKGAVILSATNTLTHYPKQPADMDKAFYDEAYAGCNAKYQKGDTYSGNVSMGDSYMYQAVDGYISDIYNVGAGVGHRLSLLDPFANLTSFGQCNAYSTLSMYYDPDASVDSLKEDFYAYPSAGYFPKEQFYTNEYWHIYVTENLVTRPGEFKVQFKYNGKTYDAEDIIFEDGYPAITFKMPITLINLLGGNMKKMPESNIEVIMTGLDNAKGDHISYNYTVKFFALDKVLTGIDLNKTKLEIIEGNTDNLTIKYTPTNAVVDGKAVWKSNNEQVAKVDNNGKITAIKPGKATITVTVEGLSKTCEVIVSERKPFMLGDVSGDGRINTVDVIMILQHISHKITLNATQIQAANTYKDSQSNLINTLDAIRILQYISHKITAF